jgi:hypothetical protein
MTTNPTRTAPDVRAVAPSVPPRPIAEIAAAALALGCNIPSCHATSGKACDADGAVHLARISLACRGRHVSGPEFVAVILTATSPVFRPYTLIRPAVAR